MKLATGIRAIILVGLASLGLLGAGESSQSSSALATPGGDAWVECTPKVSLVTSPGGFSDVLFCGEERVRGIMVRFTLDGVITAVSWLDYQGAEKYRNIQLYDTGVAAFVVHDVSVSPSFWKSSRGTQYVLFPRGGARFTILMKTSESRLIVRDVHGLEWHLVRDKVPNDPIAESMHVEAIGETTQPSVPIDFTERGIVGVDLEAAGVFYLQQNRGSFSGLADLDTREYRQRRSVFHDTGQRRCAIANTLLYANAGKNEVIFRFWTDSEVATFLAQRCPALDRALLAGTGARLPAADAPPDLVVPPATAMRGNAGQAWVRLASGTGTRHPGPADFVEIHWVGWTTDGRRSDGGAPKGGAPIVQRVDELMPGVAQALSEMVEGEERRLWLPPELTLNKGSGAPERGGVLVIDVQLVTIR